MRNLIAFVAMFLLSIGAVNAQIPTPDVSFISQEVVVIDGEAFISYVYAITEVDDNFEIQLHSPGTFFEEKAQSSVEDKNSNQVTIVAEPAMTKQEIEENLQRTYDFAVLMD